MTSSVEWSKPDGASAVARCRGHRITGAVIVVLLSAGTLAACGNEADDDAASGVPARAAQEETDGYRVIMRGVVNDTLTGRAQFGDVFDPETSEVSPIIELITPDDFAGGMFIAYGGTELPADGRYTIADGTDGQPDRGAFRVVYRQGLYRSFRAESGNLSLSLVSDTLIRGSFDAVMTGEVAERGRDPNSGEVEVSGTFSARPGQPGYIIGL